MHAGKPAAVPDFSVVPEVIRITAIHEISGAMRDTHLTEDGDLGVGDHAGRLVAGAEEGAILVALSVDGCQDQIRYRARPDADTAEMLKRGIEQLSLALAAVERVTATPGA